MTRYVGRHRRRPEPRPRATIALGVAIAVLASAGVVLAVRPAAPEVELPTAQTHLTLDAAPITTAPLATTAPTTTTTVPPVSTTTTTAAPEPTTTAPPPLPVSTTRAPEPVAVEVAPEPVVVAESAGRECSTSLDGTQPYVARAGHSIANAVGFTGTMGGRAGRSTTSDHPSGHAVDFMTSDRATGDRLAQYALDHQEELGITYVIWRQRINHGSGWEPMEDRGGTTANHYDHVHVSFEHTAPAEEPRC